MGNLWNIQKRDRAKKTQKLIAQRSSASASFFWRAIYSIKSPYSNPWINESNRSDDAPLRREKITYFSILIPHILLAITGPVPSPPSDLFGQKRTQSSPPQKMRPLRGSSVDVTCPSPACWYYVMLYQLYA